MSNEVKRVSRELAYTGTVLKIYKDRMEFSNGNHEDWDFIHHDGAAAVIPVMDDGKILMVTQYRNALERDTLEIPAGKLDAPGEPGIECARRELEEETGYRAENIEWLMDLKPAKQHLDENEFIQVKAYTLEELREMIFTGKIEDSKTIASILAYESKYCH